ncbi:MAG: DNA repair protein RadA [Schleiferiaceae bacterium]|jgi:DNA repair protein RadA/Sms|nr:DNA repair protein RadA [Schleiferiaceae bacterium]MDG1313215.1 DNA repair protein RadA [Schleiferiaceae bacterium]MDG1919143.1 DNA repair protein RadA [Schleiferiaceae bacterium]MDG2110543.1 DNA repair protein RadA [Schleiferiaceae bacterium]HBK20211.1 DNA repair protein RadA [Cryomorphaceae bacterium]|tara:strand:+ start:5466 stop:6821 length:1356 start_codon:yes stop_codon:yes gene_type:complete
MAKQKSIFNCTQCGTQHSKWMGQCQGCKEWNTLVEEVEIKSKPDPRAWTSEQAAAKPIRIEDVEHTSVQRFPIQDFEFSRVLGGGVVPGSVTLLGGEPGIGKSTLLLQLALSFSGTVAYVSGEESPSQIKLRGERIGKAVSELYLLSETKTDAIFNHLKSVRPHLVIVDSIQTLHVPHVESTPGSVAQIRESAASFIRYAKETGTPVLLIGHINKEGSIAGPKILEHMVDVVLQFEGDPNLLYRILRAHKNRFGSTHEIGLYTMEQGGLYGVENPSELLVTKQHEGLSGNAVAVMVEGVRPMLIELQALCSTAVYGTPQRSTTGFDTRRLNMLLAVLEKRCGFRLGQKDVFLNVTGGLKVDDPGLDLAVIAAILSSNGDAPITGKVCFAGEVGLTGEVRPITRVEQRIKEAEKLGFETIYISGHHQIEKSHYDIAIVGLKKIEELVQAQFL